MFAWIYLSLQEILFSTFFISSLGYEWDSSNVHCFNGNAVCWKETIEPCKVSCESHELFSFVSEHARYSNCSKFWIQPSLEINIISSLHTHVHISMVQATYVCSSISLINSYNSGPLDEWKSNFDPILIFNVNFWIMSKSDNSLSMPVTNSKIMILNHTPWHYYVSTFVLYCIEPWYS
jgi:hypothetical protein